MRHGTYEQRTAPALDAYPRHRIVMPIFIPHERDYFAQAVDVLGLSLRALRATIAPRAASVNVTLVANQCTPAALELIEAERRSGWLDQVLINQENRGKVDAVVGAARSSFEELITVSDADVLFLPGWLEAVEGVFQAFPECGAAAPSPNPRHAWSNTSATVFPAWLRRELSWDHVVPEDDLRRFAVSVGRPDFFQREDFARQLVVRRGDACACVGCGHFALTLRRAVVAGMPSEPCLKAVTGNSEERWLDMPPDQMGFWRLSTPRAWVHHMGNVPETWMREAIEEIETGSAESAPANAANTRMPMPLRRGTLGRLPRRVRGLAHRGLRRLYRRMPLPEVAA